MFARWLPAAIFLALVALTVAPRASESQEQAGEPWRILPLPQSSLVLARDGSLIGEIGRARRVNVQLAKIPPYVAQAFIAIEDQRFYEHDGVDLIGIAGALRDAVRGDIRGASTITQLVVGNMHPGIIDRGDRSLGRKLREQAAAREMERHYSKAQILETFLNLIEFGHGWNGIGLASLRYFGKPASELTLVEAATLAALPANPPYFDPIQNPERARGRRNTVLDQMAGQGFITQAQAAAAKREPVRTAPDAGVTTSAPYFVDAVRVQAERAGVEVSRGGFVIHSTLNGAMQRSANQALLEGLREVESRDGYRHLKYGGHPPGRTDYLQGSVVVVDPASGEVLALVGGRDYSESQYNRAVSAMRQPGSAFKPFVYAAAIADSMPANAIVSDTAIAIPLPNGSMYSPDNADHEFHGEMTLRDALTHSRNTVAVQLGQELGMDTVIAMAHSAGVDAPITPYPSGAIGASVVQPLDLVTAYATFATLGVRVDPRLVRRIDDATGRTVWRPNVRDPRLVMDQGVAFIVRDMMRDVVDRGTAQAVRRHVPSRVPVAGKTGTTNANADVWFVGMTPDLVAGVWIGFDRPKTIAPGAGGGSLAGPVFGRLIADWYNGRPAPAWAPPSQLVVAELDRATGELATPFTSMEQRYMEYFIPGTEPAALRVSPWRLFQWGPI